MAIYVKVKKVEEKENLIIYKYCSNYVDWGVIAVNKDNVMELTIIELAKNDPKKQFSFMACSAINRDFKENGMFPNETCFAA